MDLAWGCGVVADWWRRACVCGGRHPVSLGVWMQAPMDAALADMEVGSDGYTGHCGNKYRRIAGAAFEKLREALGDD